MEQTGMGLTADDIADHPALHGILRRQSQALLQAYEANPRLSSVFGTQQRWLLAHVGFALYFRLDRAAEHSGLTASRFFDVIAAQGVASRNTADSFLKEMLKYGFIQYGVAGKDKRVRPMAPSQASIEALFGWFVAHLATLDGLDAGTRLPTFMTDTASLARIEPLIADGLLSSHPVREPGQTFSLFTWLNNGGVVMDWLISSIEEVSADADRIPTGVLSVADMANWLKLSRTHLARKLRAAEQLGSLGWQGKRGHSVMWVSRGFWQEFVHAQAAKLAVIDAAFQAGFPRPG
jgi:hypothetical protein